MSPREVPRSHCCSFERLQKLLIITEQQVPALNCGFRFESSISSVVRWQDLGPSVFVASCALANEVVRLVGGVETCTTTSGDYNAAADSRLERMQLTSARWRLTKLHEPVRRQQTTATCRRGSVLRRAPTVFAARAALCSGHMCAFRLASVVLFSASSPFVRSFVRVRHRGAATTTRPSVQGAS